MIFLSHRMQQVSDRYRLYSHLYSALPALWTKPCELLTVTQGVLTLCCCIIQDSFLFSQLQRCVVAEQIKATADSTLGMTQKMQESFCHSLNLGKSKQCRMFRFYMGRPYKEKSISALNGTAGHAWNCSRGESVTAERLLLVCGSGCC